MHCGRVKNSRGLEWFKPTDRGIRDGRTCSQGRASSPWPRTVDCKTFLRRARCNCNWDAHTFFCLPLLAPFFLLDAFLIPQPNSVSFFVSPDLRAIQRFKEISGELTVARKVTGVILLVYGLLLMESSDTRPLTSTVRR